MWADDYVGLTFKRMGRGREGLDCFGLVRLVIHEQAGILLPSYSDDDPDGWSIEGHAAPFKTVSLSEAKPLDVAVLFADVRCGLTWKSAPVHIGVFVDAKRILHIEEGVSSRVQPASDLRIHSIVRVSE